MVRAGRDPTDLARAYAPPAQTILNWVAEIDRSEDRREAKLEPSLATGRAASSLGRTDTGGSAFDLLTEPCRRPELVRVVPAIRDGPTGVS